MIQNIETNVGFKQFSNYEEETKKDIVIDENY